MRLKFLLNMARVVSKKKLNKFRNVSIPSNKDLFFRVGKRPLPKMEDGQVASFSGSTMDSIDDAMSQLLKPGQMPIDEG